MDNSQFYPKTSPQDGIKTKKEKPDYTSAFATYRRNGKKESSRNEPLISPFFKTPPAFPNLSTGSSHAQNYGSSRDLPTQPNNFDSRIINHSGNALKLTTIFDSNGTTPDGYHFVEEPMGIEEADGHHISYFRDEDSEADEPKRNSHQLKSVSLESYESLPEQINGLGLTDIKGQFGDRPFASTSKLSLEIERLKESLNNKNKTVNTLSNELSKSQFHITQLTTELKLNPIKQQDLTTKLKSVTVRCIEAEKLNSELKNQLANREQDLEELSNQKFQMEIDNIRLNEIIDSLTSNVGKLDSTQWKQSIELKKQILENQMSTVLENAQSSLKGLMDSYNKLKGMNDVIKSLDKVVILEEHGNSC